MHLPLLSVVGAPERPHRQRAPRALRERAAGLPGRPPPSVHLRHRRRSTQKRRAVAAPPSRALSRTRTANAVVHATRPLFGPGSPDFELMALGVPVSDVEELWSPALVVFGKKRKLKQKAFSALVFPVPKHGGPFSLGRGLISGRCVSRWASSFGSMTVSSPQTTKATSWVALAEPVCAWFLSARTSLRGHLRSRAGRRRSRTRGRTPAKRARSPRRSIPQTEWLSCRSPCASRTRIDEATDIRKGA
jgi:hypothetical protein